jgi:hypothetical protein
LKFLMGCAALAAGVSVAGAAHAEKMEIGGRASLMPAGTLKLAARGNTASFDAATAFAFGGTFAYDLAPNFSIGAAPQLIINVKSKDDTTSAKQLDLLARATAHLPTGDGLELYGFAAPGFSMIFLPEDDETPSGFLLGFGAGVAYAMSPTLTFTAELGYQLGFQSTTIQGVNVDVQSDYLHLGVGLRSAL